MGSSEDRAVVAATASNFLRTDPALVDKRVLFATISGSHLWGLATAESDIDVRFVYQAPTAQVLALHPGRDTVGGTVGNIDYQGYEVGKFLRMLANHNGNAVRLLLCPSDLRLSGQYVSLGIGNIQLDWAALGRLFLTKRLVSYYEGYARSQRKRALSERGGKALVYTFREIFEGIALFETGRILYDWTELYAYIRQRGYYTGRLIDAIDAALVEYAERAGRNALLAEQWNAFYIEWERLVEILHSACDASVLPAEYDGEAELSGLLVNLRLAEYKLLFTTGRRPHYTDEYRQ